MDPPISLEVHTIDLAFLLIHGTIPSLGPVRFRSRRSWIDDDSQFTASLRKAFPAAQIEKFAWSGENSHRARYEAGLELRKLLSTNRARRQILVAHSHGGNLALYALHQLPKRAGAIAVVCFGTPFLYAKPRNYKRSELWLAVVAGGSLAGVALARLLAIIARGEHWTWTHALASVTSTLIVGTSITGAIKLAKLSSTSWETFAVEHADRITAVLPRDVPMFIVGALRDEALFLLNAMSIATAALLGLRRRMLIWFLEVASNLRDCMRRESAEGILSQWDVPEDFKKLLIEAEYRPGRSPEQEREAEIRGYILMLAVVALPLLLVQLVYTIAVILLMPILALCSTQLIAFVNLLTRSAPWGFGEHWLLQWLLDIRVSKYPWSEFNFTSIEDRAGVWCLQHCALTRTPKFLEEVWRWVGETCLAEKTRTSIGTQIRDS